MMGIHFPNEYRENNEELDCPELYQKGYRWAFKSMEDVLTFAKKIHDRESYRSQFLEKNGQ